MFDPNMSKTREIVGIYASRVGHMARRLYRAGRAIAVIAAFSVAAVPAIAQDPAYPTDYPPLSPAPAVGEDARVKLDSYAACLVNHRPKVARAILALDYRTPDYQSKLRALATGNNNCREFRFMRMAPVLFAGGLAEAAFKVDFGGRATGMLAPGDWTANPIEGRDDLEAGALCVVQHKAADVRSLLSTRVSSPAEAGWIMPLASELAGCLRPDTKFRINKPFFRAILALALYRVARHFEAPTQHAGAAS